MKPIHYQDKCLFIWCDIAFWHCPAKEHMDCDLDTHAPNILFSESQHSLLDLHTIPHPTECLLGLLWLSILFQHYLPMCEKTFNTEDSIGTWQPCLKSLVCKLCHKCPADKAQS